MIGGGFGTSPEDRPSGFAFEALTISTGVISLTASVYNPANSIGAIRAVITCETSDLRYRYDGAANPSASVGMYLKAGDPLIIEGPQNIAQFRIIRVSADGVISVTYER